MSREEVRGNHGELVGVMEAVSGDRIKATTRQGVVVGYYNTRDGKTTLPNGSVYSRGNDLRELLRNA